MIFFKYQKIQKNIFFYFACIIDLVTSLLNLCRLGLNFKNIKKNQLFIFNIKDYKLIHKKYFQY
jgi:hypothetical protein